MSYDVLVFEPFAAPRDHAAFMSWYTDLTRWDGPYASNNPDICTPKLKQFFDTVIKDFPPLDGPFAPSRLQIKGFTPSLAQKLLGKKPIAGIDELTLSEYTCTPHAIYISFAWPYAQPAYESVIASALAANVGFFDVSATKGDVLYGADEIRDMMYV